MQPVVDERDNKPSASGFHRLVHCPGSQAAEQFALEYFPVPRDSAVATQGTEIHEAIAEEDLTALGLTEEKVATRLIAMERQAREEWLEVNNLNPEHVLLVREERYWVIHRSLMEPLTSAKVDEALINKNAKTCLLMDFKTGFKRVTPANENWQLKIGLIALDQEFGPFESARVAIAQHRVGEVFDFCDYTRDDIDQTYAEVIFYIQRSRSESAPRTPGEWCQYCKAKAICREHIGYAMLPAILSETMQDAADKTNYLHRVTKKEVVDRVELLTPEAMSYIQMRATVLTNLLEAVKERLKSFSDEDLSHLGLHKVSTGQKKSITDVKELWGILSGAGLCSSEEFNTLWDLNLGRMEELLVTRLKLMNDYTVDTAKGKLYELLSPVIVLTDKSPSLKATQSKAGQLVK